MSNDSLPSKTQKKNLFTKMEYPCPHIKGHSVLMGQNDSCTPETTSTIVNTRTIVVADRMVPVMSECDVRIEVCIYK